MFRVLFPEGQLECERYERTEHGVNLYDGENNVVAFIPYENLHAVVDDTAFDDDETEPSII